ncbi:hypothetical protein PVAG01_07952 [Phlyctema vagabunda]|uniref:C2H2-type domain-containing protein n=1 Tax=Phlyctema vagabunda TaxID=108571 RepID=A0ABR4PEF0_9HELO
MANFCYDCNRCFRTRNGLNQHLENSAAHNQDEEWECDYCDRIFRSENALDQHCANSPSHPWCFECKRLFLSESNLTTHLRSSVHMPATIDCPWCDRAFTTASGLTIHLESGACSSGIDRGQINHFVKQLDRNHVITKPLITMSGHTNIQNTASALSWNGSAYGCYLCPRRFRTLDSLNTHLKSVAHDQKIYRCPNITCRREYKLLSALVQHVESENCGVMEFSNVQKQARRGIQDMVQKMISR